MTKMTEKPEGYLIKSAVEQGIHALDCKKGEKVNACRVGDNVIEALNGVIDQMIDGAAKRARLNNRITIRPYDFGVIPDIDDRFK